MTMGHSDGHKLRKTTDYEGDASNCHIEKSPLLEPRPGLIQDIYQFSSNNQALC